MFSLVTGEEEVVVRELRVFAVEAEVEHEARAGGLVFLLQLADEGGVFLEQFPVSGDDFHVGDDDVGGVECAVLRLNAGHHAGVGADAGNLIVEVNSDAEFLDQAFQTERDAVEATVHVPEIVPNWIVGMQFINAGAR